MSSAISSVKTSSMNATKVVENHFESAKKEIIAALETRMVFLLTTIKEIETQDLEPLTSLKQQLDGDLATMKNSIQEGSFNPLLSCNAPYFIISPSLMPDDSTCQEESRALQWVN